MQLHRRFRQWLNRQRIKSLRLLLIDMQDYRRHAERELANIRTDITRIEHELHWRQIQQ